MRKGNENELSAAANNLGKSKKEYTKALTDLRVYTCAQVRK